MGKNQHSKDKLYITPNEYRNEMGGQRKESRDIVKKLPFDCCSLSFLQFTNPVCSTTGFIFDYENILQYLKKYHVSPITGEKMNINDLIKLNFAKNIEGKYHCPVTFKIFNESTHIVAIKTSGNVYCYDAIKELNLKSNNMFDLLTNQKFTKNDIITLQLPGQPKEITNFYHVLNNDDISNKPHIKLNSESKYLIKSIGNLKETTVIDDKVNAKKSQTNEIKSILDLIGEKLCVYTTSNCSGSLTSTGMSPVYENKRSKCTIEEINEFRWQTMKELREKGYISIVTNFGNINLEIYCNLVPQTSENFLTHCKNGYYDNCIFHRLIPGFMIQGGDPTGTGMGGESIWGKAFKDEFHSSLTHNGRGIVSMSNQGANTNKSQFFITFQRCINLDNKHSVFGKVVGELDTLRKFEECETDKKDKPINPIIILQTNVYVNPFDKINEICLEKLNKYHPDTDTSQNTEPSVVFNTNNNNFRNSTSSQNTTTNINSTNIIPDMEDDNNGEQITIGKYINFNKIKSNNNIINDESQTISIENISNSNRTINNQTDINDGNDFTGMPPPSKKVKLNDPGFGDFSCW